MEAQETAAPISLTITRRKFGEVNKYEINGAIGPKTFHWEGTNLFDGFMGLVPNSLYYVPAVGMHMFFASLAREQEKPI